MDTIDEMDGFTLGNESPSDGFTLGNENPSEKNDAEGFSLGLEIPTVGSSRTLTQDLNQNFGFDSLSDEERYSDLSVPLDIEKIETLVFGGDCENVDSADQVILNFLNTNTACYRIVGLEPFEDPADFETFEKKILAWKNQWIRSAENEWGKTKASRLESLTKAVNTLVSKFRNEKSYLGLKAILSGNVYARFRTLIEYRARDGRVSLEDLESLLSVADEAGLVRMDGKKTVLDFIRQTVLAFGATVISGDEEFVTCVEKSPRENRFDTERNRKNLLKIFREIKSLEQRIYGDSASEISDLETEMKTLLERAGLSFLSNEALYEEEYFFPKKGHSNSVGQISALEWAELRIEAEKNYQFSSSQWDAFCAKHGISVKQSSEKMSLGLGSDGNIVLVSSVRDFVENAPKFKAKAVSRIFEGDLEYFLSRLGETELSKSVQKIRKDFIAAQDEGFECVLNLLEPDRAFELSPGKKAFSPEEIARLLEENLDELCADFSLLPFRKILSWLETHNWNETAGKVKYAIRTLGDGEKTDFIYAVIIALDDGPLILDGKEFRMPKEVYSITDPVKAAKLISGKNESRLRAWIAMQFPSALEKICAWIKKNKSHEDYPFVRVDGGSFTFDSGNVSGKIKIGNLEVAVFPVTQKLFEEVMSYNPSHFKVETKPVDSVSWYEAVKFCNMLSLKKGLECCYIIRGKTNPAFWGDAPNSEDKIWDALIEERDCGGYRLLTEAEWLYLATSKGTSSDVYAGSCQIEEVAWFNKNSGGTSQRVGKKKANQLGIYDLCGNVREWCWDWFCQFDSPSLLCNGGPESSEMGYRVTKGGSWKNIESNCAVKYRNGQVPYKKADNVGFRVARSI